jgi:hypothetical protein
MSNQKVARKIIGAWRLVSFEIQREDGKIVHPFGADPQGSIIYTESGHFSAQLMRRKRPSFVSGDQITGTPDEIEASTKAAFRTTDHTKSTPTVVSSSIMWRGP